MVRLVFDPRFRLSVTSVGAWAQGIPSEGRFYWLPDIIDISKQWAVLQDAIHRRRPGARQRANDFIESQKQLVQSITEVCVLLALYLNFLLTETLRLLASA